MKTAPSIFIGHGSPMNVIENNIYNQNMKKIGESIDFKKNIKAILCLSAHYQTEGVIINDDPQPRTIHDFYGFPDILYSMHYKAAGSKEIANKIYSELNLPEIKLSSEWGLDHGAWNVLWHMMPNKDVPVIMMSLNYNYSLNDHFELGKKLQALREEGVLILGSGNIVHSFKGINFSPTAKPNQHSLLFDQYVKEKIETKNFQELIKFDESVYESAKFCVNSAEHYIPLLYVLGASKENEKAKIFSDDIVFSTLSMTSIAFGLDN